MTNFTLPTGTNIGNVHLRISSLERSVNFYSALLGFREVDKWGHTAKLSASGELPGQILLTELEDSTGLVSFALVLPDEATWNALKARIEESGLPTQKPGHSDYAMSMIVRDPDQNAVEIVANG